MNYKTRGNYRGICVKFDCKNKDKCNKNEIVCIKFDKYERESDENRSDQD